MKSTGLSNNLFSSVPQYVVISFIVLVFLITIGIFAFLYRLLDIIKYYIEKKFNSINNHTNKSSKNNNFKPPDTYKETKRKYNKDVSELEAKIMPDKQTLVNTVDRFIEYKNRK